MTGKTNPSLNAVTGSSGTHPVPEGAADNAPPAIREALGNLPLQYADGPDYCTVTDATGGAFALTVQPELMKIMEAAALRSPVDARCAVQTRDEEYPDCTTDRERELYDALMGLSSAITARQGWSKWIQGGVQIAPIVRKALRLDASTVPSADRLTESEKSDRAAALAQARSMSSTNLGGDK